MARQLSDSEESSNEDSENEEQDVEVDVFEQFFLENENDQNVVEMIDEEDFDSEEEDEDVLLKRFKTLLLTKNLVFFSEPFSISLSVSKCLTSERQRNILTLSSKISQCHEAVSVIYSFMRLLEKQFSDVIPFSALSLFSQKDEISSSCLSANKIKDLQDSDSFPDHTRRQGSDCWKNFRFERINASYASDILFVNYL